MTRISATTNYYAIKQCGFTLLELLLAITIGAVVLSAVYTTFASALDSQRRIERVSEHSQAQRFFAERLRADLKNLLADAATFSGSARKLTLSTVIPEQGLQEISYQYQQSANGGQIRRSIKTKDNDFDTLVYENVDSLAFRYLIDGSWRNRSDDEALPQALECTINGSDWQQQIAIIIEVEHALESD